MPADGPAEAAGCAAGGHADNVALVAEAAAVEVDSLLPGGGVAGAALAAAWRARPGRLAIVPGALLAAGAVAGALRGQASTTRGSGSEGDVVQLLHEKTTALAHDDDIDSADPCKNRTLMVKLHDALEDFKDVYSKFADANATGDFAAWDPCKVSKVAAIKTAKMMNQSAHWKRHSAAKGSRRRNSTAPKGSRGSAEEAPAKGSARAPAGPAEGGGANRSRVKAAEEGSCSGPSQDRRK
ncbi:unnamed protein product, partial [Prorocentrum cordatum]